jgi:high-affinity iron transporter
MIIGAIFIAIFYHYGRDKWGGTEYKWEGGFAIVATVIITILGAALLRVSKMQEKWRVKLAKSVEEGPLRGVGWLKGFKRWCERYVMFVVPFITILREGLEAVIFIAGVSFSAPASAVPLPVVMGLIAGTFVGYLIYK